MATITSTTSGNWSAGATWVGGSAPADDDIVVIAAGHAVLMDADLSSWTGLRTLTITGVASGTPGMLYFKNGTNGYLKFRTGTGYGILGTNHAVFGRLLANSDGVWGTTTPVQDSNTAVIEFNGTSLLNHLYLSVELYATHPTNWYVEVFGAAYTCADQTTGVSVANDTITFAGTVLTEGTIVKARSTGGLPGGLYEDNIYYVRTPVDLGGGSFSCKLSRLNDNANIVDLTTTGSGALTLYTPHTNTSTATLNVRQNVTADTPWSNAAGRNSVTLVNIIGSVQDIQRVTISSFDATTITLSANVDSAQRPLSRIYLNSRNVRVIGTHNTTTQPIFQTAAASAPPFKVGCEVRATAATTANAYQYGFNGTPPGSVFSGIASGFHTVFINGSGTECSGVVAGVGMLFSYCSSCVLSGTAAGIGAVFGTVGTNHAMTSTAEACGGSAVVGLTSGIHVSGKCHGLNSVIENGQAFFNGVTFGSIANVTYRGTAIFRNCLIFDPLRLFTDVRLYNCRIDSPVAPYTYLPSISLNAYFGVNPVVMFSYDDQMKGPGSLEYWGMGGHGVSEAYVEGTHGDLQACGWALPDPTWVQKAQFDTVTLPAGTQLCPLFIDIPVNGVVGETLVFEVAVKLNTTSNWTTRPSAQLIELGYGWGDANQILTQQVAASSTDWQLLRVSYLVTSPKQMVLRVLGTHTMDNEYFHWAWRQVPTTGTQQGIQTLSTGVCA